MYRSRTVLALIPARGGSKRIPRKNIRLLKGKPLITYALKAARRASCVDRVIVSTDSPLIAAVAKRAGADVPFLRPKRLASDTASTASAVEHALRWLQKKESWSPDIVVVIQPTSPLVGARDIDNAIKTLVSTGARSCVSVTTARERPEWMFTLRKSKLKQRSQQKLAQRSQDMPELYYLNGAVYASLTSVVNKNRIIDTKNLAAIVMPRAHSIDIDTKEDWSAAEHAL